MGRMLSTRLAAKRTLGRGVVAISTLLRIGRAFHRFDDDDEGLLSKEHPPVIVKDEVEVKSEADASPDDSSSSSSAAERNPGGKAEHVSNGSGRELAAEAESEPDLPGDAGPLGPGDYRVSISESSASGAEEDEEMEEKLEAVAYAVGQGPSKERSEEGLNARRITASLAHHVTLGECPGLRMFLDPKTRPHAIVSVLRLGLQRDLLI